MAAYLSPKQTTISSGAAMDQHASLDEDEVAVVELPSNVKTGIPIAVVSSDPGNLHNKRVVVAAFHAYTGELFARPLPLSLSGEHVEMPLVQQEWRLWAKLTPGRLHSMELLVQTGLHNDSSSNNNAKTEETVSSLEAYVWNEMGEGAREAYARLSAQDEPATGSNDRLEEWLEQAGGGKFVDFSRGMDAATALRIALKVDMAGRELAPGVAAACERLQQSLAYGDADVTKSAESLVNELIAHHLELLERVQDIVRQERAAAM